jgi:cyclophilin family peptidyl-prolyl cis-trans isomerase
LFARGFSLTWIEEIIFSSNTKEIVVKRIGLVALAVLLAGAGVAPGQEKNPVVIMDTSMGKLKIELFQDKAPITVKNVLGYVNDKFYDGTVFHRVIPDFMIQGGGFTPGMKEKQTRSPIKNESDNGLRNTRGTLAMARTNEPNSATAQFFINVKDNDFLDKANAGDKVGYAVFGKVIEGMEVVDKIKQVQTADRGVHGDVPVQDVVIRSVRRLDASPNPIEKKPR